MFAIDTVNVPHTRISFNQKPEIKVNLPLKSPKNPVASLFRGKQAFETKNNVKFLSNKHGDVFVKKAKAEPEPKDEEFSFLDWYVEGIATDYTYF